MTPRATPSPPTAPPARPRPPPPSLAPRSHASVLTAVLRGRQRPGADSPPARTARAAGGEGGRGSGDSVEATLAEQRSTLARIRGAGAGAGAPAVSRTAAQIAGHLLGGRLCLARGKSAPARPPARPPWR
jgi:hypothetical protein